MSDNIEIQDKDTEDSNEWINWIEEAISKKHIKYYEYDHFIDIQEIGSGNFGKVYRANWKNSDKYLLALKSFFNLDDITAREIAHEVITYFFPSLIINTNYNLKLLFMV